ncbi:ATP-dependent helicase HrpB [Aliikangiella coralliicola]|uniref:ATP-dependent helicase HrpB n=1 Tax=Aliikangiella coralliicola TaxID=2592383 RepID=UPI00143DD99D|nr:ATP-dependent helicase HrpB [Aliikangiella coralliicola]
MLKIQSVPTVEFLQNKLVNLDLPIVEHLDGISKNFLSHANLVLQAEPGAGKTTVVPLALLNHIPKNQKILILEPRRLAARNAAERMADILGEKVGHTVGYRIRNESKISKHTRIEVITEGILTRMLQSDPELAETGLIIFDEFHERSLDADIALAFSIEVQQTLRDDLQLLVMSATLDAESIAQLLQNAPLLKCEGRNYPVSIEYVAPKQHQDWSNIFTNAVNRALETSDNDILVFLPGIGEIKKANRIIQESFSDDSELVVVELYGDLPFSEQRKALLPEVGVRKIILSTNIAETSVTIQGVDCVIDSGLMRQSEFDPNVGFNRLRTRNISQASATQRTGRAGRLGPGSCIRLWAESDTLRKETSAEILRTDLAQFALELAKWGVASPEQLSLLDQPNTGAFNQAQDLLKKVGALNEQGKVIRHGNAILSLGVHPRIGHMLIKSIELKAGKLGCLIAAMLEEKDLLQGQHNGQYNNPDFSHRLNILFEPNFKSRTKKLILSQSKVLARKLDKIEKKSGSVQREPKEITHLLPVLLAMVFPDRIAQKRGQGYLLANGSGAQVPDDFLMVDEYLVVVKLGGQGRATKIFQAAAITRSDIENFFPDRITQTRDVKWDDKSLSVKAQLNTRLDEIILDSKKLSNLEPELITAGLLQGVLKQGIENLPWTPELLQWQERLIKLRQLAEYQNDFPDVSHQSLTDTVTQWLAPYLTGMYKLSDITESTLSQALKSMLDWNTQQKLDKLMPLSIKVASGSKVKIDYASSDKPILAVKLQEMFGEKETPKLAEGRLSVRVHLLSPARRPLQITEDLASFWATSYEDVKKEMKGRYPKHPWPDDPLTAQATRYTKKRLEK